MVIESGTIYSYIGGRIRDRRKALGLTQGQVAQRLGLKRTSITNIEAGRQKLPIDLLYQLCTILDVEVVVLLPPMELVLRTSVELDALSGIVEKVPPRTALLVRTLHERLEEG